MAEIVIKKASIMDVEDWWSKQEKKDPTNLSIKTWKQNFLEGIKSEKRATFFAMHNGKYVGQGTLLFQSDNKVLTGGGRAEIIKLEVLPKFRGLKISSKIVKYITEYAKQNKIKMLTIGVEPCEVKNMQIYFHWGFTKFLECITETFPPKAKGETGEVITVLCYAKKI